MFFSPAVINGFRTQPVIGHIIKVLCFGQCQDLPAISITEELSLFIEQLECIPLCRVMACSQYDASSCPEACHSHLNGRGGCHSGINNVYPHASE